MNRTPFSHRWRRVSRRWRPAALCVLALAGTDALADTRIEAKRHFQNGMQLIARGSYDDGIEELLEAYLIKPHPNVLYNIGRAYHDAGRIPEAIDYYQRYLATRPPDAAAVTQTMTRLQASLAPAPVEPPKADAPVRVVVPGPGSTPGASDEANRKLAALVERLEGAIARAEARAQQASATPVEPAADSRANERAVSEDEETDGAVPYEELVVTASRRAQSSLEAPNASTVITADEIRLSGATSIVELLRRVPGAEVMAMGVGSANLSFRGFNQRLSNKVLVLVDGRTEYQDFLGLTLWSTIPVGLEEIERIEVLRGPGSALYGANAALGVVNIITRRPGTGSRAEFKAIGGNGNTVGGSLVASGGEDALRYRASAAYFQQDKWSKDFAEGRPDVTAMVSEPNLGLRTARGNLATTYAFAPNATLGVSGGVNRFYTELYPLGLLRNFYLDGYTHYAKADLDAGPWKMKVFWNHLTTAGGPQYASIGQEALETHVSSDVLNGEALFSHPFTLGGEHQLHVGLEGRYKRLVWNYAAGLHSELHAAAFVQDEWRIVEPFRLVASYRIDRHPLLDEGKPGFAQSPRISAVWLPFEGHAFRASYATAFREPTMLESYVDIRIPLPGVNGGSALTQGNLALRPERVTAYELGYRGEALALGLEWDLSLYQNEVKDLIGLSALSRLPLDQSYDAQSQTFLLGMSTFQNEPGIYTARGVELGAKLTPVDRVELRFSGAYQKIATSLTDAVCAPCSQAPALKVSGGISYRSRAGFDLSADAGYTSATRWIEREPLASDPTQIQALANPLAAYAVFSARAAYHLIPDRAEIAITGTHLGAPHPEHPFGNEIERRFFATLTVTP